MKAILVIDMPSNCLDCPCEYDYMRCKATNYKLDYVNADTERASWCPLKPIPNKQATNLAIGIDLVNGFKDGWNYGWNACIDEITGDNNE